MCDTPETTLEECSRLRARVDELELGLAESQRLYLELAGRYDVLVTELAAATKRAEEAVRRIVAWIRQGLGSSVSLSRTWLTEALERGDWKKGGGTNG